MGSITDIEGIKVGHVSDFEAITGCTVVLFESPVTAAVDLREEEPAPDKLTLFFPTTHLGKFMQFS